MFDLEQNIKSWCDYFRARGSLTEEDILEIEHHLRDQIADLVESGLSEEEAFIISVKRLGNVSTISEEFSKVNTESLWKHLLFDPDPAAKAQTQKQVFRVIVLALLAGTAAKLPTLFGVELGSIAYFKNLSFYILPFIAFFAKKNEVSASCSGSWAEFCCGTACH